DQLEEAWHSEAKRLDNNAEVFVHIFVYVVPATVRERARSTLVRASRSRIEGAQRRIGNAIAIHSMEPLGALSMAHRSRRLARNPDPPSDDENIELPHTHTFRQAQMLDRQAAQLRERSQNNEVIKQQPFKSIRVRLEMDIKDLRKALGLPDFDTSGPVEMFKGDPILMPEVEIEAVDYTYDD
ncbi:hypothetical protein EDD11_006919, partial [Mortierella claussenii]